MYGVFNSDPDGVVRSPVDSNINFMYFYNAYDCSGNNALRNGSLDVPMSQVFGFPVDSRPRTINQGGILIPNPNIGVPVAYGNRYIQRTDLGNGIFTRRGNATLRDGAECLGLFSMDTTMGNSISRLHPVAYALNESVWVATYAVVGFPNDIRFNYTTDRGLSWSPTRTLPTYSPWYNSVEITGNGNNFYIVSVADPNNPSAFQSTGRPCYLKGTYNPSTGAITNGTITDITGGFELPGFLANMIDIGAVLIGDTLHVLWTDWNNYSGNGFSGPGGHVHHAAVLPDGTVQGPHKVTDINIDGRLPDRSTTFFGSMVGVWPMVSLSYNPSTNVLYALWSQPPEDGNFGWADYEATNTLACYDIFCSASPNNGRIWDNPTNITQTNNPGCDGSIFNPCDHEDHFEVAERVVNDSLWVVAMVQSYPGIQATARAVGAAPDLGPDTEHYDRFRLYKVPARTPVILPRGDLGVPPSDTTKFHQISLQPRGPVFNANVRLSNIGLVGFFLDSVTLDAGLNDGFLVTYHNAGPGNFVPLGGAYDFQVSFDPTGVGPSNAGVRSGLLRAYGHSTSPFASTAATMNIAVNVVPIFCGNRQVEIHSGSNKTWVGSQGTIADGGGYGLRYELDGSNRIYDGGIWVANSSLNAPITIQGFPRRVSRQIFGDHFLRCIGDAVLDSVDAGGYYNLYCKSVGTDIADSTLIWETIWEQSTHPDSSEFLLQTVQVANIGSSTIDSVALGVIYDVDVSSSYSSPAENVAGDTVVSHFGRDFWLGWVAGNDVAIDACSPNNEMYGFVVIPGSIGNPGDFIRPRGAVIYEQRGFSYNIDNGTVLGGDTLAQRCSWNLDVLASTRDRAHDTLTGVWQDTAGVGKTVCNADVNTGPPYRNDLGYLAIAKKVFNFSVNDRLQKPLTRGGLPGIAASIDTLTMPGPKETFTVIHVASSNGLADLMINAIKGIDWYVKHAGIQVGAAIDPFKGIKITATANCPTLQSTLVVPNSGITVTSCNFTGASTAAGTYTSGPFGIQDGVILATGAVANALPPDKTGYTSTNFGLAGCRECDSLSGGISYDAAILTLTFNVSDTIRSVSFDFIYGSEEYPEWVGSEYNDVFAAYLNGKQIIYDDKGRTMTVNGYFFTGGFVVVPPDNGLEYDGSSTQLRTVVPVTRGSTGNVLKLVICDVGDHIYDSGALLAQLRGHRDSTGGVTGIPPFPTFDIPPSPTCGTTLNTTIGNTLNFSVQASDSMPSHPVRLTVSGLPIGALMSPPLPAYGNPISSSFSWTPAPEQGGSFIVTFSAKDTIGLGEVSCSYTINVPCIAAKGDMNADGDLTPADVVLMLNCVFLGTGNCGLCTSDVNCSGDLTILLPFGSGRFGKTRLA